MGDAPRPETVARIRAALAERLTADAAASVTDTEPLSRLGLDSVTLISLVADLQQRWGLSVPDDTVFDPDVSVSSLAAAATLSGPAASVSSLAAAAATRSGPAAGAHSPVTVAGLGVVAPTGVGVAALWDGVTHGRAHRIPMPYPAGHGHRAGVLPGADVAAVTGPGRLLDLVCLAAEQALADCPPDRRATVTLVVGTTDAGGNALASALDHPERASADAFPGWLGDRAAERLGLADAVTVASASAAGAVALAAAGDLLRAGDAAEVLVVGADTVSESAVSGLAALRTLSPDGCRPFSRRRRGIAVSEAAAAVLLRPGGHRNVQLTGWGGSSLTTHLAAPQAAGIALAVRRALDHAGVPPDEVMFVNTHGPGTQLGDVAEIEALREVFGDRLAKVALNSTKGVLWHCQGAAGVIESLVCVLSLTHGRLTPTFGSDPLAPQWSDLDLVVEPRDVSGLRHALSISCGLGGVNSALLWSRP